MCNLFVCCVLGLTFHRAYRTLEKIPDLNQVEEKGHHLRGTGAFTYMNSFFLSSSGRCEEHLEKERQIIGNYTRRWKVEDKCMWKRGGGTKKPKGGMEKAEAAHFHASWLFWLPQSLSITVSFLWSVPFASWLWTEMGLSARLSFEVLWLSAKRSAVPAAICEEAASSHPSLHFPSMTKRGRSQRWWWG